MHVMASGLAMIESLHVVPCEPGARQVPWSSQMTPAHGSAPTHTPARHESLTVAAPVGLALRPSCRQLVRELGQVSEVELVGGSGPAVHLWRWLLAASYAGVAVRASASAAAAPVAAEPGRDPAYCDVLFTHGQLRRLGARLLPLTPSP